jgi:hypothetical protein
VQTSSADEWSQQAFECYPMTKRSVLKKYVPSFHIIQMKSSSFLCAVMGMGQSNNQQKKEKAQCHM